MNEKGPAGAMLRQGLFYFDTLALVSRSILKAIGLTIILITPSRHTRTWSGHLLAEPDRRTSTRSLDVTHSAPERRYPDQVRAWRNGV